MNLEDSRLDCSDKFIEGLNTLRDLNALTPENISMMAAGYLYHAVEVTGIFDDKSGLESIMFFLAEVANGTLDETLERKLGESK